MGCLSWILFFFFWSSVGEGEFWGDFTDPEILFTRASLLWIIATNEKSACVYGLETCICIADHIAALENLTHGWSGIHCILADEIYCSTNNLHISLFLHIAQLWVISCKTNSWIWHFLKRLGFFNWYWQLLSHEAFVKRIEYLNTS